MAQKTQPQARKVADLMTKTMHCVDVNDTLKTVAMKMKQHNVGAMPVCEQSNGPKPRPCGMITDRDIVIRCLAEGRDYNSIKAGECCTRDVVRVFEDEPMEKAAEMMKERKVRRLMVFTRDDTCQGIISLGDLAFMGQGKAGEVLQGISMGTTGYKTTMA